MKKERETTLISISMLLFLYVEITKITGISGDLLQMSYRLATYVGAALLVYSIGRLAVRWQEQGMLRRNALKAAGCFYGLYVLSGMLQRLSHGADVLDNLIRVTLVMKVPPTAGNWLFGTVWFVLAALVTPYLIKNRRKFLLPLLAVLGLAVTLIPGNFFGYPWFGVFFGTDIYACIPVLAFTGYFLAGACLRAGNRKKELVLCGLCCIATLGICLAKKSALMTKLSYPSRYWEVLLPVGFAGALVIFSRIELLQRLYKRLVPSAMVLSVVEITGWYILRGMAANVTVSMKSLVLWTLILYVLAYGVALGWPRVKCWLTFDQAEKWSETRLGYLVIYTAGFIVLAFLVFLPFLESNRTFIWNMDGVSQYFPRAVSFSTMVRDMAASFLKGDFQFDTYNFTWGLGDHIVLNLNPFYWCYALFSPEHMEAGYQVMTFVRFYLTGLSALALLRYLKKGRFASLLGSFVYTFCGFALHFCLYHPQFSYALIFLPILLIAVEEILQKGEWYLGTAMIGFSLLCSYYFLYINTIALVVYFLVRFLCMQKEKRTLRQFFRYLFTFAGTYLLGVGIGFLGIMTSLSSYAGSSRTASGGLDTVSGGNYGGNWIMGFFEGLINTGKNPGYSLRLGFVALTWIAVVLLCMKWKKYREHCILLFLCFVASCLPVVAYIWNGFAYVSNRWSYIIALLMAVIVAEAAEEIRGLTKREIRILLLACVPYMAVGLYYGSYIAYNGGRALAMLVITLLVVVLAVRKVGIFSYRQMQIALFAVVAASLLLNSDAFYAEDGLNTVSQFVGKGTAYRLATNNGIQAADAIEDDSFYRIATAENDQKMLSGSLIENVNSIAYYNSTYNKRISDFLAEMGVTGFNKVMYDGFDNRGFLNLLAGVKYYVTVAGDTEERVPYGYTYQQHVEEKYPVSQEDAEAAVEGALGTDDNTAVAQDDGVAEDEMASGSANEQDTDTTEESETKISYLQPDETEQEIEEKAAEEFNNNGYLLYKTDTALPLGYTYDHTISPEQFAAYTPMEKQEVLMTHAVTEDGKMESTDEPQLTGKQLPVKGIHVEGVVWEDGLLTFKAGDKLRVYFDGMENAETYIYLKGYAESAKNVDGFIRVSVWDGEATVGYSDIFEKNNRFETGQEYYIFNTGYRKEALEGVTITFTTAGSFHLEELGVYGQSMAQYDTYAAALSENALENVVAEHNQVSGTISLDRDKLLVLSIPYEKGWTAYVDGEKTELFCANLMYSGMYLAKGEHEIRLCYERPGLKKGICVSLFSVVVFAGIVMVQQKRKKKK